MGVQFMQTFTGRVFYPGDMSRTDIHILDIAEALSKQCRYGGHCLRFYSVAEHSIHVYRAAQRLGYTRRIQRAALLHDASEAYLVDIPRALKPVIGRYYEVEDELMHLIAAHYDFDWPMPPEVKYLDNAIIADERDQNMRYTPELDGGWSCDGLERVNVQLQFWSPIEARERFLEAYYEVRNIEHPHGEV